MESQIEKNEQEKAERLLFARVAEAELRVQNGERYMTIDELREKLQKIIIDFE